VDCLGNVVEWSLTSLNIWEKGFDTKGVNKSRGGLKLVKN